MPRERGSPEAPQGTSSASRLSERPLALACWALVAAFVLLAARELYAFSALRALLEFLLFWLVAPLGIGLGAIALVRVPCNNGGRLLLGAALGWPLSAAIATAAIYAHAGAAAAFWLLIALGLAGRVVDGRAKRRSSGGGPLELLRAAAGSLGIASSAALIAGTFLVFIGHGASKWVATRGASAYPLKYFDLTYHLAFVKRGILAGLPVQGYPLIAQFSKLGYHPSFDTLASVLIKGMHVPIDSAYYAVVLPATYASFLLAIFAVLVAWSGRMRTALVGGGIALVSLFAVGLPKPLGLDIGVFGLTPLRWFMLNPPGALGVGAVLATLALLVAARRPTAPVVALAGLLLGATVAMKAQVAIAAGPAFVVALAVLVAAKRASSRVAALGGGIALVSAALAYLTTLGAGAAPALQFGAMAEYLTTSGQVNASSAVVRWLGAHSAASLAASVAFLLFYVLIAFPGWRLVAGVAAIPLVRRQDLDMRDRSFAVVFTGMLVVGIVAVSLLVVQRASYVFLPWNISWHAMQVMWPLSVVFAAIVIDAAVERTRRPVDGTDSRAQAEDTRQRHARDSSASLAGRSEAMGRRAPSGALVVLPVLVVVVSVAVVLASAEAMRPARTTGGPGVPLGYYQLVQQLPQLTPVDAVVAQNVDVGRQNWLTAFGGRRAYAERLVSPELTRGMAPHFRDVLAELYSSSDPLRARDLLAQEHIDYVIVKAAQLPAGLAGATKLVTTVKGFQLRVAQPPLA